MNLRNISALAALSLAAAAIPTNDALTVLERMGLIRIDEYGDADFPPSDADPGDEHIDDSIPVADRGNAELIEFISLVRSGEPVPVDISTALAAQGFDVDALEARYS